MTIAFILYLVSVILAIPMRIWEYITVIDKNTGFFNEYSFSVWALLAIFAIFAIVMAFMVFRDKNTMDYPYRNGTKGLGILFLLLSVSTLLVGLSGAWFLPAAKTADSGSILSYLMAFFSLIIGISMLIGKTQTTLTRFLLLTPVFWGMIKVWSIYLGEKPVLTVSQHLIELLGYVSTVLFLMALASAISGFGVEKHNRRIVYFGFMSAFLLLTASIPRIVMIFLEGEPIQGVEIFPMLVDICLGLIGGIAPLYICFGVDPLLDFKVLYEGESVEEDPLAPESVQMPMGPAVPSPNNELHSGFTTLMEGMDGSMWERNIPMQADSVDEGYRYAYDSIPDEEEDLTAKKIIVPERAFYTNPNFVNVEYGDLFKDQTQEQRLPTAEEQKRIDAPQQREVDPTSETQEEQK